MKQERHICDRCGAKQDWDRPNAAGWQFVDPENGVHIYTRHFGTLDLCPDCARGFEQWFVGGAASGLFEYQDDYDPERSTHQWPEERDSE